MEPLTIVVIAGCCILVVAIMLHAAVVSAVLYLLLKDGKARAATPSPKPSVNYDDLAESLRAHLAARQNGAGTNGYDRHEENAAENDDTIKAKRYTSEAEAGLNSANRIAYSDTFNSRTPGLIFPELDSRQGRGNTATADSNGDLLI